MTQRPLAALMPELLTYIEDNRDRAEFANRLNLIDQGQLKPEIEKSLLREFKPSTVAKLVERIPSINLLKRIVDKLSRIYDESITRSAASKSDSQLVSLYKEKLRLDDKMSWANRMYNLHESCAIEPYLDLNGHPQVRVLSPDRFLVWSDDPTDETNPTVFIKFMGDREDIAAESHVSSSGIFTKPSEETRVSVYRIYSDTEYVTVDHNGRVLDDGYQRHDLGCLPIVYVNSCHDRLLPLPNTDTLDNTILIPKLLGDINYAVKYLAHSIFVARDLKLPDELEINPDTILEVSSINDEIGTPGALEVIMPKIDIEGVLKLAQTTLATWLESLGIRPGTMGQPTGSSRTSALAKIVDEADTTALRNQQVNVFTRVEKQVFDLLAKRHNLIWKHLPMFPIKGTFSSQFTLTAMFPEQKVFASEDQRIERAERLKNAGLATARQCLRVIYPNMTDQELDAWVQELKADGESKDEISTKSRSGTTEEAEQQGNDAVRRENSDDDQD